MNTNVCQRWPWYLLVFVASSFAQPSPNPLTLDQAYEALRNGQYERAIMGFRANLTSAAVHKDLAYTLLKIGENEEARDHFAEAMRLDPSDDLAALEYAFLAYETKKQADARRVFDRVRKSGNSVSRSTAELAFQNIDRPLADGITRWQEALRQSPDNFSAHRELARLAEQRDDLVLAAEHYAAAWKLRPKNRQLLVDLGRVRLHMKQVDVANALLLAASRGAEPHAAEEARSMLPERYPYVYEFREALKIDPDNIPLRRELAYLLLEMQSKAEAEEEFRILVDRTPDDLLSIAQLGFLRLARKDVAGAMPLLQRVMDRDDGELADRVRSALGLPQALKRRPETPRSQVAEEARTLGMRSYEAGYLKDALKYLTIAHESDPVDFDVMLKLGWTNNLLKNDEAAWQWFNLARQSPDTAIATEASRAYKNLRPEQSMFRTSIWLFPFYSSRWNDVFAYGQVKTEFRVGNFPVRPYVSLRFIGDVRGKLEGISPQYLSESAFILGVGAATRYWHGFMGWVEAGTALSYLGTRPNQDGALPDYRGGVSFAKGFGSLLGSESSGWYYETNGDGVYISRFDRDFIGYSQNRTGYTLRSPQAQFYWNHNITVDTKGQYWANYVETGPGVRFRVGGLPKGLMFQADFVRGIYLMTHGNPYGANYWDLRSGLWYAFTR